MTTETDEHGRPEPPIAGDEWETLTGFLEFLRATFAWKTSPDWDFDTAIHDDPATLVGNWEKSVSAARDSAERAYAEGGLDALSKATRHGETHNLRWVMTHMIEEYARHNGHVDLIRESIDGLTGE